MKKFTRKRSKGTIMAEIPAALWLFLFFLCFPLMGYATEYYRATLVFFAVRDATYQAAKQQTFTQAQAKAQAILAQDAGAWNGVHVGSSDPTVKVVILDSTTSPATETEQSGPLAASQINTNYFYLIRTYCNATIDPIVNMGYGGSPFANIPGLTGPIPISFTYQVYAENPQGLAN